MNRFFEKFKKDYQGKKVLVMGLGLLGRGVADAKFFAEIGAKVTVTDLRKKEELKFSLEKLRGLPIRYVLGRHQKEDFVQTDLILRNPAVSLDSPFLKLAKIHHIPVEMDEALFAKYAPVNLIGITGTRGKSTTTVLIYKILKSAGYPVWLGGNIKGKATLPLLKEIKENSWVVLELSSWQLQGFRKIKISPQIAVLTNIYEDHLNRYKNMSEYIADKKLIFEYQTANDFLIINKDLKITRELAKEAESKIVWFSKKDALLIWSTGIKIQGEHNQENIAAAMKVAEVLKIKPKVVQRVISSFRGLKYRLEKIATISGVDYINDTTSTTPIAAIKALQSFKRPLILITGGASKNLDMKDFALEIVKKTKGVILLEGTATRELQTLINKSGGEKLILGYFNKLNKALQLAKEKAIPGDIVLFSPGCASFGMFKNEFDRGEQFNKIVKSFKND